MSDRDSAIAQIRTARMFTCDFLGHIPEQDWFRQPSEGVTHVAWQVGHLAVAEYGLALKRVRGEQAGDEALIGQDFRRLFGKGSAPSANAGDYPAAGAIRAVFDRVHERVLEELQGVSDGQLQEAAGDPHPMFRNKLGALQWCAMHEFVHAGQIALLRRLFGATPLR